MKIKDVQFLQQQQQQQQKKDSFHISMGEQKVPSDHR